MKILREGKVVFAAIYVPNFALQAVLRHEPALNRKPVALVDPQFTKTYIVQLNEIAGQRGVTTGLTASQALARCMNLIIKARSLAQEQAATDVLLQTAYAFSARIESTDAGVCTLSLQGLGLPEEALEEWANKIRELLATFGLIARIGFSVTPGLALLAAKSTESVQVIQNTEDFLAGMPVEALEPEPRIQEILSRWGVKTVGAFVALGKDKVLERLGAATLTLFERVSPAATRPLKLVMPEETFSEQMEFEVPMEMIEPLLFVLRRFVEQLSRRLEIIYLVAAELHLELDLTSGARYRHEFRIPSPTGNVDTLFRMLHTHLETLRTDAPIRRLGLSAKPARPELHQFGLFETTLRNPNQFAETLARLTGLCGNNRAGTPVPEQTHRPDAFTLATPDFEGAPEPRKCAPYGLALRRFRPAVAAIVQFRAHRPAVLHSDAVKGPITEMRGPFMSSGHWWEKSRWAREEWDVALPDGTLYRIFRAEGGYFVEGVYD